MLGRYQVERELGKGAMGVVYRGKDPKIGRVVAIKTMALSQEFEADELEDVRQRFFREAETAGRLNHPNIVTIKVTDFGIARITDSSKTKTGMVLGTPSYMSPEQLAGNKIDGQSDLFSLGVTLYQLSCGSLPFQGDSMTQLMFKIANEPPIDILSLNPALPECVVEIIDKALAKNVAERYQSGGKFAQAVRACAAEIDAVDVTL